MPAKFWALVVVVGIWVGLLHVIGDEYDEQAAYCGQVDSGIHPDYKGVYKDVCGGEPPRFSNDFWLHGLDEQQRFQL